MTSFGHGSPNLPPKEPVALPSDSVFRIGNPRQTEEWSIDNRRVLKWLPSEEDFAYGEVAGWAELPNTVDEEGFGYIEIPAGTRSASSVLSGLEAWEGEKASILDFLVKYQTTLRRQFGVLDSSVTLETVAIAKDRFMFVTPPHAATNDFEAMNTWHNELMKDLDKVLAIEPNREELLSTYQRGIEVLGEDA